MCIRDRARAKATTRAPLRRALSFPKKCADLLKNVTFAEYLIWLVTTPLALGLFSSPTSLPPSSPDQSLLPTVAAQPIRLGKIIRGNTTPIAVYHVDPSSPSSPSRSAHLGSKSTELRRCSKHFATATITYCCNISQTQPTVAAARFSHALICPPILSVSAHRQPLLVRFMYHLLRSQIFLPERHGKATRPTENKKRPVQKTKMIS